MDYRKMGDTWYIRLDKGDEIISSLLMICKKEEIASAVFCGIGGCSSADLQTFLPEEGIFETEHLEGMLELINVTGNIITEEPGVLFHHTHAMFSYKENEKLKVTAGHVKEMTVLYTAEIELRPVYGGVIRRKYDEETGTGFWDLKE